MDFITFQSPIKRSGTVIWYASIQDKALKSNEYFQHVVSQLTASEQTSVKRFIFEPDQKRALLSILLQRALIHKEFDFTNKHDFQISRTQEGKPYLVSTRKNVGFWNYNVSHHGDFVCIAADHESLVSFDMLHTLIFKFIVYGLADWSGYCRYNDSTKWSNDREKLCIHVFGAVNC